MAAEVICCSGTCVHDILVGQLPAHLVLHVDSLQFLTGGPVGMPKD